MNSAVEHNYHWLAECSVVIIKQYETVVNCELYFGSVMD